MKLEERARFMVDTLSNAGLPVPPWWYDSLVGFARTSVEDERAACAAIAQAQYKNAVDASQAYGEWARCAQAIERSIMARGVAPVAPVAPQQGPTEAESGTEAL